MLNLYLYITIFYNFIKFLTFFHSRMKLEPAKKFEKKSVLMKKVTAVNALSEKDPLPPIQAKSKFREKEKPTENKNSTAYQVN